MHIRLDVRICSRRPFPKKKKEKKWCVCNSPEQLLREEINGRRRRYTKLLKSDFIAATFMRFAPKVLIRFEI